MGATITFDVEVLDGEGLAVPGVEVGARYRYRHALRLAEKADAEGGSGGTGGTCDTASGAGDISATVDLAPSGTVTFLFTDIEGSTRLSEAVGDGFAALIAGFAFAASSFLNSIFNNQDLNQLKAEAHKASGERKLLAAGVAAVRFRAGTSFGGG